MAYTKYLQLPNRRANAGDRDHLQHIESGIVDIEKATYDLWPTGSAATDIPALTAAASRISDEGGQVIRLAPGHYDFTDVTPDDIHDLYIVGDNVTVTPHSYIYPFSSEDSIHAAASRPTSGQRGRIAIELDDALIEHWTHLFPATKEMGIPLSSAWHTDNGAKWIKEAHRHGWEIMSHLPEDIRATDYLANGQLDAVAQESLDAVRSVTGQDRVGFVYPQHQRSLETDRVLSKYYAFGRGVALLHTVPQGVPRPWLVASFNLDSHLKFDGVSQTVKQQLRTIASANLSATYYFHLHAGTAERNIAGLRDLVATARSLGIEITTASQISGVQSVIPDPYFEDTSLWSLDAASSWDTTQVYHGTRSIKVTPSSSSNTHVNIGQPGAARVPVPTVAGHFTVLRASVRRKHDSALPVSANGQGLVFRVSESVRNRDGTITYEGYSHPTQPFPVTGSTLDPAPTWSRMSSLIYIPPTVEGITVGVAITNILAGAPEFWLDELKFEVVDYVANATFRGTLAGTAPVRIHTGIVKPNTRHIVQVIPDSPPAGTLSVTWLQSRATITSTDESDTMGFSLVITPRSSYSGDILPETGA